MHDRDALAPDQPDEVPQELEHEHDEERSLQHASPPQMQTMEGDPITVEPLRQRPRLQAAHDGAITAVLRAGGKAVHEDFTAAVIESLDHMADDPFRRVVS